jgi:hypothetical protein
LIGAALAAVIKAWVLPGGPWWGVWAGWGLAWVLHGVGLWFFVRSIGRPGSGFLLFGLGAMIARLFVLIIFFLIVLMGAFADGRPFVVGALSCYFVGVYREITLLARVRM